MTGSRCTDAVSYVERHNEANGEDNHDGHPANFTSNWGVEGQPTIRRSTRSADRVKRAMLATVFLAAGTPMLLAGDEFGRTQHGNNNAYCQDNEISWLDWSHGGIAAGNCADRLCRTADRAAPEYPVLRSPFFCTAGASAPGIADIAWFDQDGQEQFPPRHGTIVEPAHVDFAPRHARSGTGRSRF